MFQLVALFWYIVEVRFFVKTTSRKRHLELSIVPDFIISIGQGKMIGSNDCRRAYDRTLTGLASKLFSRELMI
jgi:hypothetical protein